jgi:DNA modification methylase
MARAVGHPDGHRNRGAAKAAAPAAPGRPASPARRGRPAGEPKPDPIRNRVVGLRLVPAEELQPNESAWRRHPKRQREALAGLLQEIGFAGAVLARRSGDGLILLDGHLRRDLLPGELVPTVVTDLTAREADILLACVDEVTKMATPDRDRLAELLNRTTAVNRWVTEFLDDLARSAGIVLPGSDDRVLAPPAEARTRRGDLWILGPHRLLCGDATVAEDVGRLLGRGRPALMVTDPPYGVDYRPAWRQEAATKGLLAYAPRRVEAVPNDDRADWTEAFALAPSDVVYCWHAGVRSAEVQLSLEASGFAIRFQIMWRKPRPVISRGDYHWAHEPCFYAVRRGRAAHWRGGRRQSTVWDVPLDPTVEGGLGVQKPVECMERAIRNHDAPEVYDPFVGSGTTIVAAERAGRRCFAMDVDPRWCDTAVGRWERHTGRRARRAAR